MNVLATLRQIYETKLSKGPFPTKECADAGITYRLHGELLVFFADIAGIASHGERLESIGESRRREFQRLVERSFWERWPDARVKITPESTPELYELMEDTEMARLMIRDCLNGRRGPGASS